MFKILGILNKYIKNIEDIDAAINAAAAELDINIDSLTIEDKTTLKYKASIMKMQHRDQIW